MDKQSLSDHKTDKDACAYLTQLVRLWQDECSQSARLMSVRADILSSHSLLVLDAQRLYYLAHYKTLCDVADSKLLPHDKEHATRILHLFVCWLYDNHRADWECVATWLNDDIREQEPEFATYYAKRNFDRCLCQQTSYPLIERVFSSLHKR